MVRRAFKKSTNGALTLSLRAEGGRPWWWYLDLQGTPLYLLGNDCGTCPAIFKRIQNAALPLTPEQLSTLLDNGLDSVSQEVVDTVAVLLPQGRYEIELSSVTPALMGRQDLTSPISCEAEYFWLCHFEKNDQGVDYEMILPLVASSDLNPERIAFYKAEFEKGRNPTALAFSMHDGRAVGGRYDEEAYAHFLLDGHHKVMAASQLGRSISLLSFVHLDTYREIATAQ